MLNISVPIWKAIPQMAYFQYPWRFLALSTFAASFLGGSFIILFKSKTISLCLSCAAITAIALINAKLFTPQYIRSAKSTDFTNEINLKWRTSKISDEYMPKNFIKPRHVNEIPNTKFIAENSKTKINIFYDQFQRFSAGIFSKENSRVIINVAYFPAWHIFLDNSEMRYEATGKGLRVIVPKGEHILSAEFIQTPIEEFANILTITGVIALFIGIITHVLKKYAKKTT